MQNSQLNSLILPTVGSADPATVTKAAVIPLRVVVFNLGAVMIFLAHDAGTLQNVPVFANAWQLLPGKELTIVLAPKQGLFATGSGNGAQLSVAINEALPLKEQS
jgi:hypothetical protein